MPDTILRPAVACTNCAQKGRVTTMVPCPGNIQYRWCPRCDKAPKKDR